MILVLLLFGLVLMSPLMVVGLIVYFRSRLTRAEREQARLRKLQQVFGEAPVNG